MRKKAFTLAELLTVVAILAVLAAIFVPTVHSVFAVTRRVQCMTNLYHIHAAIKGERAETAQTLSKPLPNVSDWPGGALSMLSSPEAMRCPEDPRTGAQEFSLKDLKYKSGIGGEMMAFDPTALSSYGKKCCAIRRGEDRSGTYTEFVIEENPDYESVFVGSARYRELSYAPNDWSDNDGVWRAHDNVNGRREVRMVYYTCGAG
ncbi:MAG TPA: prepilin-type N-terminal cleavage/methylation domain-containing protein, partial [Phycisphaerae bacterium]|nr:prepilin-type N-terminal cleavage/methylation domain-containing protein [Phycisphaerae bacterium]